ncbi:MAG: dihydrodipicolinate synthase family protein [Microthrixaceae bacterium]|nr:dihydrodipicolinate synthase family protein [Microthrixaceae bacterium]
MTTIPTQLPGRAPTGMSAILLPFTDDGDVDWAGFEAHVRRTTEAGLAPAVNMDTGYVQLIDDETHQRVLDTTHELAGSNFVAGAFVPDAAGDAFDQAALNRAALRVADAGGTPVIFPSHGLNGLDEDGWVAALQQVGATVDRFIGFELGAMFVPYGRIYSLDAYAALMAIDSCIGAKHSSLSRAAEWDRLALRDRTRPDFSVFTGNDLAIDMIVYGSDYLLGLSTMAPDLFAIRDRLWAEEDARFWEVNDLLQYLGFFTFRDPVPGYRHNAATVLQLRGWITSDAIPPGAPKRPDSDRAVLADIANRINAKVEELS